MNPARACVLNPHSNTNPSDKYVVVMYDDWLKVFQGEATTFPSLGEYDNYTKASTYAAFLNKRT